ncbi:MAG: hypothetical protein BWX48_03382 [Verrucomicrobia bacterium ADurb.Bin006]|nr:MAG: hypothetical protein BWX48_03382 [Verrucomicrobia bacterium ADurb.Bin006]
MLAGVGRHLAPVHADGHLPELHHLQFLRHLQHLHEALAQQGAVLPPEPTDRVMVRMRVAGDQPHRHVVVGRLLDAPRAESARRVAVDRQSQHHRRRILRVPASPHVDLDSAQIQSLHRVQDEVRQVVSGHPVAQVHRQQQGGVTVDVHEAWAHSYLLDSKPRPLVQTPGKIVGEKSDRLLARLFHTLRASNRDGASWRNRAQKGEQEHSVGREDSLVKYRQGAR